MCNDFPLPYRKEVHNMHFDHSFGLFKKTNCLTDFPFSNNKIYSSLIDLISFEKFTELTVPFVVVK